MRSPTCGSDESAGTACDGCISRSTSTMPAAVAKSTGPRPSGLVEELLRGWKELGVR
jgi:hypothetical protein